ncbi:MAG: T9SS type A sorting domain-containing protein [Candidatus Eisenbacteria bacterium]|uniref:T9SS type A sorting domain-containing protein n=1 Tax=Eiseniibacteriota bacterium TaxID=2212470 RepID=A0A948WEA5_UNCEI|nr:T9SS type A sorting domain-containing protein [Candidatus Eisenbacteria bacterium]MBU1948115.1 T9SS type A sorting domain-containing protein [Candidatus Eisenbacteria bacterium]MBU2692588.1 T9SS type A sorting domain-containing protein [Candidatus Eisenbacteria bacterium]
MKRKIGRISYRLVIPTLLLALILCHPTSASTLITRHVFGLGGGAAVSANYGLIATLSQDVAGEARHHEFFIGSGFWHGGTPTTDVGDPDIPLPICFALSRIMPNPFTPSATIRYDVPALGGSVKIDIFNVTGRRIKTLVDAQKTPGQHSIVWDGRNDWGKPVGAGVYFVAMNAPGYRKSQRLICIR